MAKNILSQVFPSDTAVSSLISQTKLDDVFVHCETNNKLAISTVRVVHLAALAVCSPAVLDDIAAGKTTFLDAVVEALNSDIIDFKAISCAFLETYLAALEAKEIRRSLFEGESKNDYVAFTKPNVDRILNVIAKAIKVHSEGGLTYAGFTAALDMAKVFKGFAIIANFLSNGRIDAAQADAILCSYGLVKPVAEQAQKDIEPSEAPKCEAQKPANYDAKLVEAAKALRDAYCSALSVRYVYVAKDAFTISALSQAVAKASDLAVVEAEEVGKYGEIIAKHAYLGHGRVITRYFTITPECRLALKAQCEQVKDVPAEVEAIEEPNNDALLAAGKPLVNVMGFFEVYKLKDGYEFNLTNLICKFLVYIRDNLATEAEEQKIGEYTCKINRPVATDEERYWVCKGDYLQEHCALVKTGSNSYSWTQLDFSQAAKICEAAGVKIDADFSQAFLSTPLCHGGEKGPLLNTLGFISAYTSILFSSYGAAGNSAYQLAMAFERKIKKMFKDCLYDNGNYIYVPLNSFEGGLGKDYTYDKVAHMLLKLSINMLPKLKITEAKMRECLSSFLRLYRAMFYIFVQDDYWRYSQDPVTQDYIFTPYYDHKSHAA